jgi:hypothetical protein
MFRGHIRQQFDHDPPVLQLDEDRILRILYFGHKPLLLAIGGNLMAGSAKGKRKAP